MGKCVNVHVRFEALFMSLNETQNNCFKAIVNCHFEEIFNLHQNGHFGSADAILLLLLLKEGCNARLGESD